MAYEPDPKEVVDDVLGDKAGEGPEVGDDLEAAMADLGEALAKKDWKAAAAAWRHADALSDSSGE